MTASPEPQRVSLFAFFSLGFRPFFLGGAIWAAGSMLLWIGMLAGHVELPTAFDPTSWHAHEFLFGYLGAILAGFALTAVPNWTGRKPVAGMLLAVLFLLWIAGRFIVAFSAAVPALSVALVDLVFPTTLILLITRDIIAGRNWRNLVIVALLLLFITANALFHFEAANNDYAAQGTGLRLGLATSVLLIAFIGGRIVPTFTRNWMKQRGETELPVPPMQRFDKIALAILFLSLAAWVFLPFNPIVGAALLLAGILHIIRLARWRGNRTGSELLVWVLHAGYLFVPLGAFAESASILLSDTLDMGSAQHVWMAGAIGLMTLAVMTRATLGHSGHQLKADRGTGGIYLCLIGSVLLRFLAAFWMDHAPLLHNLSGLFWIAAFSGFAALYGPMMFRPRR